jgi:hypothetical protein
VFGLYRVLCGVYFGGVFKRGSTFKNTSEINNMGGCLCFYRCLSPVFIIVLSGVVVMLLFLWFWWFCLCLFWVCCGFVLGVVLEVVLEVVWLVS